jgi:predicted AlkP superfamily phosphohydrolase/phosphomutase
VKQLPRRVKGRYKAIDRVLVDFARTTAWCEVLETRSAGIWLNVRGRQPQGWIAPGGDYERHRTALIGELRDLRDGGRPVFDRVMAREDCFAGPAVELAPDILLSAARPYGFTFGMRAELRAPSPFVPFEGNGYTGAHERPGVFVMSGPGVAALGRRPPRPIEALAPTFLALLGLPVPEGMRAAPLLDLLTPAARAGVPLRYDADRAPMPIQDRGFASEEDRERVEEQLRALGYLE